MALTIGVPNEPAGENRVALNPDVVKRLKKIGVNVVVEKNAGVSANISDDDYLEAGAELGSRETALGADLVLGVAPPSAGDVEAMKPSSTFLGFLSPLDKPELTAALAKKSISGFSMELVPRISRAQKMDALSAMANIAGYKAVIVAADLLPKYFPLLTTAAGTVKPANVLVLGAGVAGLQAIATARRLGARVAAYDIRDAVKEQVESLGGRFVELDFDIEDMEDKSGYARELGAEKAKQQTKLLVPEIAKSDVIISTALIPGRPAPTLVTAEAVEAMKPGSVIVDLAASNGGNCVHTRANETTKVNGVTIVGTTNYPSEVAEHATQLYARTLLAMLQEMIEEGELKIDFEDEVMSGSCVTRDGEIVNERVKSALQNSN